ncbi:MAG: antitoxin MazE family protein [Boseongicola sp.]|nr:antitoxin MazE family protein [Boseongicola sp.]
MSGSAGLRPVQIWVPDTRRPGFAAECRRQARLARLPQLEGFEVRNPLIFLNPTPKGRHYTAADGQRVARRHEESRGAPCAGRVMPSWCSRSSCSFLGWV